MHVAPGVAAWSNPFLHHVRSWLTKTIGLCINGALAMRVPLPNAYFLEIGLASWKFMLIRDRFLFRPGRG